MKTGPFGEHSPLLNDIRYLHVSIAVLTRSFFGLSYVPHQLWEKVHAGMIKMYQKEVLDKFVVIQHVLFGSIFPLN